MYKITWDKETGGVLLHTRIVDGTLGVSPRPVFFEELDLLGLDKLGWKYPHCEEPSERFFLAKWESMRRQKDGLGQSLAFKANNCLC